MRVKKIRTTISLNEDKFEHLEKIMKEKGLKSVSKSIEYLIDHHQNRLSNHIIRELENIYLLKLIKDSNIKDYKKFIKQIYKNTEKIESIKIEVFKEIKEEEKQKRKEELKKKRELEKQKEKEKNIENKE